MYWRQVVELRYGMSLKCHNLSYEIVVLCDEKIDIYEAQHPPMPENLHVLVQTNPLLIYRFLTLFCDVGSCGVTLLEYLEVLALLE